MILLISTFVNSMFARYSLIMGLVDERITLFFSIIEHCFEKEKN